MRALFWLVVLPCVAQTSWVSIATPAEPYQYFRYAARNTVEQDKFAASNPHPHKAYLYRFQQGPVADRTVCALHDRPEDRVFWYLPDGTHLDGHRVTPLPSEFNVSAKHEMRGFAVDATFAGSAKAAENAMEVVYFTDRVCSDAGVEYGFARTLGTDNVLVYWSTFANCGDDAASLCRKTNDGAPGAKFENVQQENGSSTAQHGFRIYGLAANVEYSYRMYVKEDHFRIEVWNGTHPAQCSETENAPRAACAFDKEVEPWFPLRQLEAGYLVTGTLGSTSDPDAALRISDILVLK